MILSRVREYIPLVLLTGFVILNALAILVGSHLVSPTRPTPVKAAPYESGMPPLGDTRERFSVKFYLNAMLFIVFDIEVVFMMPWAVAFRQLDLFGLGVLGGLLEMGVFVVILAVGYIYVWKRGALEWT